MHILSSCPGCTWIPNGLLPSYKSGCFSVILLFTKSPPKILPEAIYLGVCTLITSSFAVAWTSKMYPYTEERRDVLGCTSPATNTIHLSSLIHPLGCTSLCPIGKGAEGLSGWMDGCALRSMVVRVLCSFALFP